MKTIHKILGISAALILAAYSFVKCPCVKPHWERYKHKKDEAIALESDYSEWKRRCEGEAGNVLEQYQCDLERMWYERKKEQAEKLQEEAEEALEETVKSFF